MRYELLTGTGLRVSRLCIGTATFGLAPDPQVAALMTHMAIDHGVNFFDTANSYGNQSRFDREGYPNSAERISAEEVLGDALKGKRDGVVLSSKVSEPVGDGPNDGSWSGGGMTRKHVTKQLEQSLQRLQTDYLDIYHVHHPDPATDVREWILTLDNLVRQGKIRHYALSTFAGWQLAEAVMVANDLHAVRPAAHQTRYNLLDRAAEREILPSSNHFGVSSTVFSPLAGGLLSGSSAGALVGGERWGGDPVDPSIRRSAETFIRMCASWGLDPATAAISWLFAKPGVASTIVGPERPAELIALLAAGDVDLDPEQVTAIDQLIDAPGC